MDRRLLYRHPGDLVINHFVPDEHLQWIGPLVAIDRKGDHRLQVGQPFIGLFDSDEGGVIQRSEAISSRAA